MCVRLQTLRPPQVIGEEDCSPAGDAAVAPAAGAGELTFFADADGATIRAIAVGGETMALFDYDAAAGALRPVIAVNLTEPVTELTAFVRGAGGGAAVDVEVASSLEVVGGARRRLQQAAINDAVLTKRARGGGAPARGARGAARRAARRGGSFGSGGAEAPRAVGLDVAEGGGGGGSAALPAGIVGIRVVTQGAPGTPRSGAWWLGEQQLHAQPVARAGSAACAVRHRQHKTRARAPNPTRAVYEWGVTPRSGEAAAAEGLKRVAADVGSGKLAGVTLFKHAGARGP